ncbi:uncharacterized protein LOC116260642 [Nymphaea colorata]|uniref:uncharacterized protein LOC116260642 n=1 Tax=Nymphaea colorata TaxID=210225 RepID=UPI00129D9C5C|nr:uncharacterized protein LOC116260642 [Nymphaea colorata]
MATQLPSGQTSSRLYPEAVSPSVSRSGSIGPFFAVIAAITVLTALSCVFGRIFASGLSGSGGRYDCVRWMEVRCRSCIQSGLDEQQGTRGAKDIPTAVVVEVPGAPAADGSCEGKTQGADGQQPPAA